MTVGDNDDDHAERWGVVMRHEWMLSFPQFWYVWQLATRHDRLPYPVIDPMPIQTTDEETAQLMQIQQWWQSQEDQDLLGALRTVVDPAMQITLCGTAVDGWEARMVGVCEGSHAVLLHQHPFSKQVQVWAGGAPALASRMVLSMPTSPPGHGHPVLAPVTESHEFRAWDREPVHRPRTRSITEFTTQPQRFICSLIVTTRQQPGRPRQERGSITFVDIDGDGRYLLRPGQEVARPAAATDIHEELRSLLAPRNFFPY